MSYKIIDYLNMYFKEEKKEEKIDFDKGVCFGCALKAIEAFCLGPKSWDKHQDRLLRIQQSNFTSKDKMPLSLQGYLQRIALGQYPSKFKELFPKQTNPFQCNVSLTAMAAQSRLAEIQGGIQEVYAFSGVYNYEELHKCLTSYMWAMEANKNARCALLLGGYTHAIVLAYDTSISMWFLENHGTLIKKSKENTYSIVAKINKAFANSFNNPLIITIGVYATDTHLIEADKAIKMWCGTEEWQEINKVTKAKAKIVSVPGNASWLYLATRLAQEKIVKKLLKKGADIEAMTDNYCTPLSLAVAYGHQKIAKLFILYTLVKNPHAPIPYDIQDSDLSIVWYFFQELLQQPDFDISIFNWTVLHIASYFNEKYLIQKALKEIDIETITAEGYTALHIAAAMGHLEAVKLLLTVGANINALTIDNETPLHLAGKSNQVEVFKLLLAKGARVNGAINKYLPSQIENQAKFLQLLKEHRAKPKVTNLFFTSKKNTELKTIRNVNGLGEFAGKLVVYDACGYIGGPQPIMRKDGLKYAFIDNQELDLLCGKAYKIAVVQKPEAVPSNRLITNDKLSRITLTMRLATPEEITTITHMIAETEAKLEDLDTQSALEKIAGVMSDNNQETKPGFAA